MLNLTTRTGSYRAMANLLFYRRSKHNASPRRITSCTHLRNHYGRRYNNNNVKAMSNNVGLLSLLYFCPAKRLRFALVAERFSPLPTTTALLVYYNVRVIQSRRFSPEITMNDAVTNTITIRL